MANTQTSTTTLPSWVQQPTQSALGDIQSWLKSKSNYVYGSKPGESLFTPMTQSQKEGIGNVNWLADQNLSKLLGLDKASGLLDQFSGFKPGKLTDEGGYLGSIDSDMNPYLKQVLDPQIREINEQLQTGVRDLGASQQSAGAFGDARHGVFEGLLYDDAAENVTDITGRTYADAFNNAMGMRSADRDAAFRANDNKATAAQGHVGIGQNYLKNFLDVNDALFNAGGVERDVQEEQRKAKESFQTAIKDKRYNDALKMLGALQGTAQPSTTTSEQSSNDGIFGILGSLLGGLF